MRRCASPGGRPRSVSPPPSRTRAHWRSTAPAGWIREHQDGDRPAHRGKRERRGGGGLVAGVGWRAGRACGAADPDDSDGVWGDHPAPGSRPTSAATPADPDRVRTPVESGEAVVLRANVTGPVTSLEWSFGDEGRAEDRVHRGRRRTCAGRRSPAPPQPHLHRAADRLRARRHAHLLPRPLHAQPARLRGGEEGGFRPEQVRRGGRVRHRRCGRAGEQRKRGSSLAPRTRSRRPRPAPRARPSRSTPASRRSPAASSRSRSWPTSPRARRVRSSSWPTR